MRARDQSRFEAPDIEEPEERAPVPWGGVLLVFMIVLTIAVGLGALYALVLREPDVDPNTIVVTPTDEPSRQSVSPQEAVEQYLEALSSGDITTALSMGELGGIGSKVLLEEEAHARMREKAPISDIRILTEDPNATAVEVSYTLAGTPVTTTIPVVLTDTGNYQLERTTVTVVVELSQAEALPLQIHGVEVPKFVPLEVVPGVYELSTGLPFIEYPRENSFTIGSLQFADETPMPATPTLTSVGVEAFRTALRRSLDMCSQATDLNPEGCPQGRTPAKPIAPGTVRWQLVGNPLAASEPSLSTDDLTVAAMAMDLTFNLTFEYADGSMPGTDEVKVSTVASANMLGRDESEVSIIWRQ